MPSSKQPVLFSSDGEPPNDHYTFPRPQYLGAKYLLLGWIHECIHRHLDTQKINSVLDAFSGSQSVAYFFKKLGYSVHTNDFLSANHQIGLSLIENKQEILNQQDINILFAKNNRKKHMVETLWAGVFFTKEESIWLDQFRANVGLLENAYKQALALSIINRAMQRKVIMGHFAHMQALKYANDPIRVKRNASIAQPIKNLFTDLLNDYNQAVFDNGKNNKSYNENILNLLPNIDYMDLVYFDPPYTDSHSDYQAFYHLLESYTEYWENKTFKNGTKRYYPPRFSGFDKKTEVWNSFDRLFTLSQKIPYWVISWNSRSYPHINELRDKVQCFKKKVVIEQKQYTSSRGGKGSVAGSSEFLLIGY